ncbi:PspC domain-containing protein [Parenemella sanctibonifatiensis]|uniref:Phage shock protein PspC N-terminal domain-containing protein n=1 Tax=Parenemella sanctibonifatiensis TaxID=2016505 RepID=A0A255EEV3_9ACTN|nr:PspC domain-containing protein [Parenemella sanctibonifatiensis]OYN87932.1 hypothetical protein CGZ92_06650 [Parenemella sanctibonifatiensis]
MSTTGKQLRRSTSDKLLGGVCGGLAKYLGVDVTIVRVAVAVLSLFAFTGVVAYLVCWLVIPQEGATDSEAERLIENASQRWQEHQQSKSDPYAQGDADPYLQHDTNPSDTNYTDPNRPSGL